jgi:hypothetical protein
MKVPVEKPYTLAELKPKLEERFPEYKITFRGPKMLIIGQGNVAGAQIIGEKKNFVRINEGFPTMGGQMLFLLFVLLLGVMIPFIIFLTTMKPKQVKVRDAVADYLRQEYGTGAINTNADLLDDKL